MLTLLNRWFGTSPFVPHGHCYLWNPGLVWLNVVSDALIAIAYYAIPIVLIYIVRKRGDMPFDWIFFLFGGFILACGSGHLLEILTLWYPAYWLATTVKALTAAISVGTAIVTLSLIPKVLAIPSPAQLEATNHKLAQEILERQHAERELQQSEQQLRQQTQQVEAALHDLQLATEQRKALSEVITKIRSSLDISTLFQLAAMEVRQLLQADRVGVFRFYPNSGYSDGEFVSEDVLPDYASALAAKIHDHCFGDRFAADYQNGRVQAVGDIYNADLSDCHIEVLSQFQIKANLVVPLVSGSGLWGLLCIHQCAAPRQWEASEIEFAQQIADQLSIALQQAELLAQTKLQAEQLSQTLQNLQQTQTHLIQTEKMSSLGQLVAGVAHEVNNPVNFIYGNLDHISTYSKDLLSLLGLYEMHYPDAPIEIRNHIQEIDLDFISEDLPRVVSSMKMGADRIRQIVLSLRNFSRLDEAEMKVVDIHEGIDNTLLILQHRLKPTATSPGIQLQREYGHLPLVECYPGQLNQVFMNILSNAIDALEEAWLAHTEAGADIQCPLPAITVRTTHEDNAWIQVAIIDNGSGIPKEVHSRLFDPFFTTKPLGKGTGLGLSISYQIIVEKHGGTLQCLSEPGKGTEFQIRIPIHSINASTVPVVAFAAG